jgi:hypothetical protein
LGDSRTSSTILIIFSIPLSVAPGKSGCRSECRRARRRSPLHLSPMAAAFGIDIRSSVLRSLAQSSRATFDRNRPKTDWQLSAGRQEKRTLSPRSPSNAIDPTRPPNDWLGNSGNRYGLQRRSVVRCTYRTSSDAKNGLTGGKPNASPWASGETARAARGSEARRPGRLTSGTVPASVGPCRRLGQTKLLPTQ